MNGPSGVAAGWDDWATDIAERASAASDPAPHETWTGADLEVIGFADAECGNLPAWAKFTVRTARALTRLDRDRGGGWVFPSCPIGLDDPPSC
ncbi:hypothetical protein [Actinokineospora terrae]|uniref:Uncharacterized protein n=1 Tax=Actinokineospora terrae TaxID=155974 RepID=A0A1H9XI95_9PSEU|nr:hypothetical protein [Actinokineospora terrae]SES45383.1 hypothetical protein SAMN04487818_11573 [Actinokineospora terrae]